MNFNICHSFCSTESDAWEGYYYTLITSHDTTQHAVIDTFCDNLNLSAGGTRDSGSDPLALGSLRVEVRANVITSDISDVRDVATTAAGST